MKKIQILGTGCPKCRQLAENAQAAAQESGTECEIEKVADIDKIIEFGVMMTPVIAIDGAVKASGKVSSVEDIKNMLQSG